MRAPIYWYMADFEKIWCTSTNISPRIFIYFFAAFTVADSPWWKQIAFSSFCASNVHVRSDIGTHIHKPHTHTHTPIFHSSIHSSVKDKRQGAEHQQQWCSADPGAVGLTHVARQTKREANRARIESEEEGKLSSLIHLPADLGSNAAHHLLTQAIRISQNSQGN